MPVSLVPSHGVLSLYCAPLINILSQLAAGVELRTSYLTPLGENSWKPVSDFSIHLFPLMILLCILLLMSLS